LAEPVARGGVVDAPQRVEQALGRSGGRPAGLGVVAVVPGPDAVGRVALAITAPDRQAVRPSGSEHRSDSGMTACPIAVIQENQLGPWERLRRSNYIKR
jgi:hypothetical protein